ncbi:unnamed protein product [Heligmosomoides polygyrus]|uniref:Copper transport protein n=1 Tax=Heligmosomoides polygyrus TaxID=6339 RepID=A0A183G8Y0_HELPZ|nr:unnamed protein product [Heligmosomoides polygyrus]
MDHDHHSHHHEAAASHGPMVAGSASMDLEGVNDGHGSMHSMAFHFGTMETVLFNFWRPMNASGKPSYVASVSLWKVQTQLHFLHCFRLEPTVSSFVLLDALLHFVQIALGYSLMLVFMTFNVWLCSAVLLGEVGSRLLFAILFPYVLSDSSEGPC